jgi:ATP-dependent HslUV protease ATP-binding subunit HslU
MVFYMPGRVDSASTAADDLSPKQIVAELDRSIVGQARAKRAVAIALRNRIRRRRLDPEIAAEITPKNILMIGPTGVGKTEIARRLAKLAGAPFIKVEASKFTEVGYVGRDVESMIRDLVDIAIDMVGMERRARVRERARGEVDNRILDLLLPEPPRTARRTDPDAVRRDEDEHRSWRRSRDTLRRRLEARELDDRTIEVQVESSPTAGFQMFTPGGLEEMDMNVKDMLPGLFGGQKKSRKVTVAEARELLQREEEEKLIDQDQVQRDAIERVEESGIVFVDEMDKIAGSEARHGPDVSREGVQRDLLPIVEGTLVKTKYGMVRTDHVLFVAAGAFHLSKPSDLIPELQGRFPIRVELSALTRDDLARILTEPDHSLVRQYTALMSTEGVALEFREDGIAVIAEIAEQVNQSTENIGARRLHTMIEQLLEEVSFEGADLAGSSVVVDGPFVRERLGGIAGDDDLSRFIL